MSAVSHTRVCDKRASVTMKGKLCEKGRPATGSRARGGRDDGNVLLVMVIAGVRDDGRHGGCCGDEARDYQTDPGRWY